MNQCCECKSNVAAGVNQRYSCHTGLSRLPGGRLMVTWWCRRSGKLQLDLFVVHVSFLSKQYFLYYYNSSDSLMSPKPVKPWPHGMFCMIFCKAVWGRFQATKGTEPAMRATHGTRPAVWATSATQPAVWATTGTQPAMQATSDTQLALQATSSTQLAMQAFLLITCLCKSCLSLCVWCYVILLQSLSQNWSMYI